MKTAKRKKTIERIIISKTEFLKVENQIRLNEHLRRYAAIRRFCYGNVLDFACGCGYGSYLISVNPDVTSVCGIDLDQEAVEWAKNEFASSKIKFINSDFTKHQAKYDTLVCLETIEHIKNLDSIVNLIKKCKFNQLIISFPDKKSTHFNKFHFHDFVVQDVVDLFPEYLNYHGFRSGDVQFLLFMKLPDNAPHHIFRNVREL
jgi:2-polyprenyl-3-methyl-5-hydroxy-6-metoxy-1,4-benzoquinol methylase